MKEWKKYLVQSEARELAKIFCKNFKIDNVEIFYVDKLNENTYGEYSWLRPQHILLLDIPENPNPIGTLIHELTHHLQFQLYEIKGGPYHGYEWKVAKKKVIKWAKNTISDKSNWNIPLKAYFKMIEMRSFRV